MIVFTWDRSKEIENILKHGVSFTLAGKAFDDPKRIIHFDPAHSGIEDRYFCFGKVGKKVLTVRFTYRGTHIRIIGAGYWRKGEKIMKKKTKNRYEEDFPSDQAYEIPDFLPPPSELANAKTIVTVTIGLDLETIRFFKEQAEKRGKKYQRMIREVLDRYAEHYRPRKSA